MPLEHFELTETRAWGFWRITEDESALESQIAPETIAPELTNQTKRLEYAASRLLVKSLLAKWHLPFEGIIKDEAGKPFLKRSDLHLSLSHSYPYVAVLIDKQKSVGIDLEQPKEKLLRIAHRVMNAGELENAGTDIVKHCIFWCAKETLIKVYGKRHLHLSKELAIEPFSLKKEGILSGNILADDRVETHELRYRVYDNFVLVLNQ